MPPKSFFMLCKKLPEHFNPDRIYGGGRGQNTPCLSKAQLLKEMNLDATLKYLPKI